MKIKKYLKDAKDFFLIRKIFPTRIAKKISPKKEKRKGFKRAVSAGKIKK